MLFDASQFTPLDPTQEPIFPPALKVCCNNSMGTSKSNCTVVGSTGHHSMCMYLFLQLSKADYQLEVHGPRVQWYRPATLDQLLGLRHRFPHHSDRSQPQYRIVAGNTEIGELVHVKLVSIM